MIQNLNQMSFQKFGTLLPDRNKGASVADDAKKLALDPLQTEFPLYCAAADTTLQLTGGKSVLSVSNDGESFLHFYFDKPVCIKTNTYFCLFPFKGEATVLMRAPEEPTVAGSRPNGSLRLDRQARVEGIYTFFYQEREQGFIFSGEEHPMPELTYVDQGELHTVADGIWTMPTWVSPPGM